MTLKETMEAVSALMGITKEEFMALIDGKDE